MQRKLKCQGSKEIGKERSICSLILCAKAVNIPQLKTARCRFGGNIQLCSWLRTVVDATIYHPHSPLEMKDFCLRWHGCCPDIAFSCHPCLRTACAEGSSLSKDMFPPWGSPNSVTGMCRVTKRRLWPQVSAALKGHLGTLHEIN